MMNRFGDIDCSFKRLPPVYGYHSEKLLPIEKSLQPIESQIAELPRYIKIAKQYCHYPSEHGLSKDQSAAIYIYTMEWGNTSLYRVINKVLRSEDREALTIWFPYLKLFDTALDQLPTIKGNLWRGISLDIGKDFTKNQIVTWWTINSCSSSVDVIRKFLGKNQSSTLFLIEAINGKKVSGYTKYENEDEVILRIGTQFRVKSNALDHPNGSHIVHLIEIDDNDDQPLGSNIDQTQLSAKPSNKTTSGEFLSSMNINIKKKWKQNGSTIAGGNGQGDQLNQLSHPEGIYFDDDQHAIYIADWENDRIIQWKYGAKNGKIIGTGTGFSHPTDILRDKKNDSLIICDLGNSRVVQYSLRNDTIEQIIISDIDCVSLVMDQNGNIYVSDCEKHQVKQFKRGDKYGTIVAGGNGKGNRLNQFNYPTYIFIDKDDSLYVSDTQNHRVMKWIKGAKEGIVLAGGQGQGNSLLHLDHPHGVIVDHEGHLYIADSGNHRIMRWLSGYEEGDIVLGGNGDGDQTNQFNYLRDISLDREGNIYVVDYNNHRIQIFYLDTN